MNNQKGMSLVEVTIAMAIMGFAAVGYMTHMQTVAKNEARQRAKSALSERMDQVGEYLKSGSICKTNAELAFKGVSLTPVQLKVPEGQPAELGVVGKHNSAVFVKGANGLNPIVSIGDIFDGDRIYVSDVRYEMKGIEDVSKPGSAYDRKGKLKISVDFETCPGGGRAYSKVNGHLKKICPSKDLYRITKSFTKVAAYKFADNYIPVTPEGELQIYCADSQDALFNSITGLMELKDCVSMASTLIKAGVEGETPCGIEVKVKNAGPKEYTTPSEFKWNAPQNLVPNSAKAIIVGAGGGGGGSHGVCWDCGEDDAGLGGGAGEAKLIDIPGKPVETDKEDRRCTFIVGKGGNGGGRGHFGEKGTDTVIICKDATPMKAHGGDGGLRHNSDTGGSGSTPMDINIWGPLLGVGGHGNDSDRCSAINPGARGGGGAGTSGDSTCQAGRGGDGVIRLIWKEGTIKDPQGALKKLNMQESDLMK